MQATTIRAIPTTLCLTLLVAGGCVADTGVGNFQFDGGPIQAPVPDAGEGSGKLASDIFVHTANMLYTMNPQNFNLVEVGDFDIDDSMTDLAVTSEGEIFGITDDGLYRVDLRSGRATIVGAVPGDSNVGLTFLSDGRLLATDSAGGVRAIDPSSGRVSEVGNFGGGYATAGDLVGVSDGRVFAIADEGPIGDEQTNNALLTIDPETGRYQDAMGQIGFGKVWGAAATNGNIYAFTGVGEIIEVDPLTGAGTLVRKFDGIRFWGAGVAPSISVE